METIIKKFFVATSVLILAILLIWLSIALYVRYVKLYAEVFDIAGTSVDKLSQTLPKDYVDDANGAKLEIAHIGDLNPQKPVVLYLFGRSGRTPNMMQALAKQATVVSPAYQGYYASEGRATPKSLTDTVDATMTYLLQKGYKESDIIVIGHSLGTAPALYATNKYSIKKAILISGFYSIQSMCEKDNGLSCALVGDYSGSVKFAKNSRGRIEVFQTKNDEYVPLKESEKLFAAIKTKDKSYTLIDGSHAVMDMNKILGAIK